MPSWFYPGNTAGWEFVHRKSERLQVSSDAAPAERPEVVTAAAPAPPDRSVETTGPETSVPVEAVQAPPIIRDEAPVLVTAPSEDLPAGADSVLPETAGYSASELI